MLMCERVCCHAIDLSASTLPLVHWISSGLVFAQSSWWIAGDEGDVSPPFLGVALCAHWLCAGRVRSRAAAARALAPFLRPELLAFQFVRQHVSSRPRRSVAEADRHLRSVSRIGPLRRRPAE